MLTYNQLQHRIDIIRYLKRITRTIYFETPISLKQYHHWLNLRDKALKELKTLNKA